MSIIIKFENDDRVYELDKNIIKKYPNSILSLYDDVDSNEPIIIKDATYEQFGIVYDVIIGKVKQWTVNDNILSLMDKYGLVNDSLLVLDKIIKKRMHDEFVLIDKFLNDKNEYWLMAYMDDQYEEYKNVFKNNKNIMSFQITFIDNRLFCINLMERIPIWFNDYSLENNVNVMDVNEIRYNVIVKNLNCIFDKCKMCEKCEPLKMMNFKCEECVLCKDCKSYVYVDDDYKKIKFNKNIYHNDSEKYFKAILKLSPRNDGNLEYYQKLKPTTKNIINWSNIASNPFTDNINKSLNEIAYTLSEHKEVIQNLYKEKNENIYDTILYDSVDCCSGPIVTPTSTYKGFINVNHILQ